MKTLALEKNDGPKKPTRSIFKSSSKTSFSSVRNEDASGDDDLFKLPAEEPKLLANSYIELDDQDEVIIDQASEYPNPAEAYTLSVFFILFSVF